MTPTNVLPLRPEAAKAINQHQAVAAGANPAALPFQPSYSGDISRMRSLDCLTQAIYYEAANEPTDGQRAVAQVVLNRVRHRAYPNTVCGVVYQGSERRTGCQFSFTCDGSLRRQPSSAGWARARQVAERALAGEVFAPVGYSTHYHADYVVPYWSPSLLKTAIFGRHIFYRSPGAFGRPSAFSARYVGVEPDVAGKRATATEASATIEAAAPVRAEDAASVTYIDFDELATRPPEEKAGELDAFGLLDYRAAAPADAAPAADETATQAAVTAALVHRTRSAGTAHAAPAVAAPTS